MLFVCVCVGVSACIVSVLLQCVHAFCCIVVLLCLLCCCLLLCCYVFAFLRSCDVVCS